MVKAHEYTCRSRGKGKPLTPSDSGTEVKKHAQHLQRNLQWQHTQISNGFGTQGLYSVAQHPTVTLQASQGRLWGEQKHPGRWHGSLQEVSGRH